MVTWRGSAGASLGGDVHVDVLDGGALRLDGGAMFRVVPRALWERALPPDDRNRVRLAMRPTLVRAGGAVVLVDSGIGAARRDARFAERVALEPGPGLPAELGRLGLAPADVTHVVLTHLHFDHAGGLATAEAPAAPAFPNARVVVQRGELEDAAADCPLCRASYVAADLDAVRDRLLVIEGDPELVPGVRLVRTGGHTRAHQVVRVEGPDGEAVVWGDLVPTASHLRPHWVMGFDLFPVDAYAQKRRLLPEAAARGAVSVLYHEPGPALGTLAADGDAWRLEPPPA